MKVAIVGDALSTRDRAPFSDPSWEIWGIGNGYLHLQRITRYFELHRPANVLNTIRVENWWPAPLRLGAVEVLTHPEIPDKFERKEGKPEVRHFPYDALIAEHGRYFTSSFAWITAYALTFRELTDLAVYGLDMSLSEYATQKACFEHYLGIAKGRGVHLHIPAASLTLRAPFLYALETEAARHARDVLGDQRAVLQKEIDKHLANLNEGQNARVQIQARMAEHGTACDCATVRPCGRLAFLKAQLEKALGDEVESSKAVGQFRARYQENIYYARNFLIPSADDIDRSAEDAELPKWSEPLPEYHPELIDEPGEVRLQPRMDGQLEVRFPAVPTI